MEVLVSGVDVIEGLVSYLDVVDPDHVRAGKSNGIAAPDVLRVELGDVNVLDDYVFDAVGEPDTLALDHTFRARADDCLVRGDHDRVETSLIVSDGRGGRIGLVVSTPIVLVDGGLAAGASSPRCATRSRDTRTSEVECLAQQNDARARISKVGDQLLVGGRSNYLSGLDEGGQYRS
jgi:hypothetical protein